jgi:hypothetical protein
MTENTNDVTAHGCIVCARLFDILAVVAPDGSLVGCNTHSAAEVEAAYKRWRAGGKEVDPRQNE